MSPSWNDGYFTEGNYTFGYYRELSPLFQRFCLLLKGIGVDPYTNDDHHCELGFGQGLSFAIHAATNPGNFYGNDFNPSQALNAQSLINSIVGKKGFAYDDSFAEFLLRKTPNFNSISLHGIWSWVSPENQSCLISIAKEKLLPGGHVYISYNTLPGWSAASPLRHLLTLSTRLNNLSPEPNKRIKSAIEFADGLLNTNPKYLLEAPGLKQRLEGLKKADIRYLAHEYFNDHWNCMYFSDVVQRLSGAKLEYATTAEPGDLMEGLNLSPESSNFIKTIGDPILQEQCKDYCVSRQFRKDIYVKGMRLLSKQEQINSLRNMRFVLVVQPEDIPKKLRMPVGEIELKDDIYQPIMQAFVKNDFRPLSLAEIAQKNQHLSFPQCIDAIMILTHFRFASPCNEAGDVDNLIKATTSLNNCIVQEAKFKNEISWLASPVIGGGVNVNRIEQLFLLAMNLGLKDKEIPKNALDILWNQGERVLKDEKMLETYEDNLAHIEESWRAFSSKKLNILKALRVH